MGIHSGGSRVIFVDNLIILLLSSHDAAEK